MEKFSDQSQEKKNSLISFIVSEWMETGLREKLQQIVLMQPWVKCYRIISDSGSEVQAFQCQQEEADGALLLHASNVAEQGYEGVVICSKDTDFCNKVLAFHTKIGA